jgi:hypothetical protein
MKIFYGIPIFQLLEINKYDDAAKLFIEWKYDEQIEFNYTSSLKKILNIGINKFNPANKHGIKAILMEKEFIKTTNSYYMRKIYNNLVGEEREEFLNILFELSDEITYNGYHYELISFLTKIRKLENIENIKNRIIAIKNL